MNDHQSFISAPDPGFSGCEHRVLVGIDVVDVSSVQRSIADFGDRYECRLFTDQERAEATGAPEVRAASLAARFAAKEATLKALGVDHDPPPWTSIELRRKPSGQPSLHLHGDAARLAAQAQVVDWSVSLSHDAGVAAAVVVALTTRQ